jgi:protein SCO1/2
MRKLFLIIFLISICGFSVNAEEEEHVEIGIEHDKRLGKTIPLDEFTFTNSDGRDVTLREAFDGKPVVLSLVYFQCPGICSPLLNNFGKVIDQSKVVPGEDYKALSISFDPSETAPLAQKWKSRYLGDIKRDIDTNAWEFMVGDSANIKKLTDAVGFYYKPDGQGDFIHSGALIVLSPDGKITRYLLGTTFMPFDFRMAVVEAGKGISSPPINRVLEFCFSYDPEGQKYVFNFNRIAGTVIFLGVGIFLTVLIIRGRNKKVKRGEQNG